LSISRFGVFRRTRLKSPEPPIRAELFSIERLEQHAESLAAAQHVAPNLRRSRPLAKRLYDNTKVLTEAYHTVVRASSAHQPITPAAEWLLDNFHIVDEQIREINDDLPPGFYRRLPKLADGPLHGYPRVFGVAWAPVAHTDSVRHGKAHSLRPGFPAGPTPNHRGTMGARDHPTCHAGRESPPPCRGDHGAAIGKPFG
jgi:hypothetical protein